MAPHPLLKPRLWGLLSGSGGSPAVRAAAVAFWLAGAAMVLAWMAGLIHEVVVWGAPFLSLMAGLFVTVGWCWLAWSAWFTWRADRSPITLLWAGPVREVEEDGVACYVGGFRVVQWHAAVRVEVLADLQRWMLLRVTSQNVKEPRHAWLWLNAKAPRLEGATPMSSNALHHLRSLLYLPSRLTTAHNVPPSDRARLGRSLRPVMASGAHLLKFRFKLRATVSPSGSVSRRRSVSVNAQSAFASTIVMTDEGQLDSLTQRSGGKRV